MIFVTVFSRISPRGFAARFEAGEERGGRGVGVKMPIGLLGSAAAGICSSTNRYGLSLGSHRKRSTKPTLRTTQNNAVIRPPNPNSFERVISERSNPLIGVDPQIDPYFCPNTGR
jgi:hypothetical protein